MGRLEKQLISYSHKDGNNALLNKSRCHWRTFGLCKDQPIQALTNKDDKIRQYDRYKS